jgi:hypothetical protein
VAPQLEVFKAIVSNSFPLFQIGPLFFARLDITSPSAIDLARRTRSDRFDCIRYVYERGRKWTWYEAVYCGYWATLDEIKFITDRCMDSDIDVEEGYEEILLFHLRARLEADLSIVSYLLEKSPYLSHLTMFEMAFMFNFDEIIDVIRSSATAIEFPSGLIRNLQIVMSGLEDNMETNFIAEKLRSRPKKISHLFKTLQSFGPSL